VNVTRTKCNNAPLVAVTLTVNRPTEVELSVKIEVAVPPFGTETLAGVKIADTWARGLIARLTEPEKP